MALTYLYSVLGQLWEINTYLRELFYKYNSMELSKTIDDEGFFFLVSYLLQLYFYVRWSSKKKSCHTYLCGWHWSRFKLGAVTGCLSVFCVWSPSCICSACQGVSSHRETSFWLQLLLCTVVQLLQCQVIHWWFYNNPVHNHLLCHTMHPL